MGVAHKQLVGLDTVSSASYVGLEREAIVDQGDYSLRVHDGLTAGGHKTLMADRNLEDIDDPATARSNLGVAELGALAPGHLFVGNTFGVATDTKITGDGTFDDAGVFTLKNSGVVEIDGLILSTAGNSATFGVAAGVAADSTHARAMNLASAFTKTTSAWASGTGNGSLDTGTIATSTWYHVFLIEKTDFSARDILISLSLTSPTLPTGYTYKRLIGSLLTDGSSKWMLFIQDGDTFYWDAPSSEIFTTTLGTSPVLYALKVPLGLSVKAIINGYCKSIAGGNALLISSPLITDVAVYYNGNITAWCLGSESVVASSFHTEVLTDTSKRVRARASGADCWVEAVTVGYVHPRGR